MIPVILTDTFEMSALYDSNGKALYDSNGLKLFVRNVNADPNTAERAGFLSDAISCVISRQLNGEYELEMEYPITGQHFDKIAQRSVILASAAGSVQPFRVYRITKPLNGVTTIYARHLAYDLMGVIIEPFTASNINAALDGMHSHAMTDHGFTFSSSRATVANFKVSVPTSAWDLMGGQAGSLLDVYGGEYDFDGRTVTLENSIGANNGVKIRYGVNMTDLEQDESCANTYSGCVGFWADQDGNEIHTGVIQASGNIPYVKIRTVDFSGSFETMPTMEQLRNKTVLFMTTNKVGVPAVSWKVEFVPLSQTEEYKNVAALETVNLGDTVGVTFEKMGVDASARAVAYEWDALLDRYNSVTLGSVKSNLPATLAGQAQQLDQKPNKSTVINISKALAAVAMGKHGGSIRALDTDGDGEPDEFYVADNPDPALAQKVWRFNYMGLAASKNGYNGPFVLGATLEAGIVADFITAGVLNANLIKVISSGDVGGGYGDCSMEFDGQFIKGTHDNSGNQTVRIGSQVDTSGDITYVHGDMKMYLVRNYQGQTTYKEIIWLGGEDGANGLVISSPDDSAKIALVYNPDIGVGIQMRDYDGNVFFDAVENGDGGVLRMNDGTIRCKRLIVNGTEITP